MRLLAATLTLLLASALTLLSGCFAPNTQLNFAMLGANEIPPTVTPVAQLPVNTQVDLLWVVDNSTSMDVEQQKLRDGISAFSQKYLQPTWDIHIAVIPTDLYLAASEFNNYRNGLISGSTNFNSTYINSTFNSTTAPFVNPASNPSLLTWQAIEYLFVSGLKVADIVPAWGTGNNYSQLLAGTHDGPIAALCSEYLPYFLWGQPLCSNRDSPSASRGVADCLNPPSGQTSVTQCINTLENNTIHSGQAILQSLGTNNGALANSLKINITTGTSGHGSDRGMQSVLQLLTDNEAVGSTTRFFRPGSARGIIFVSTKDDHSMQTEASPTTTYNPYTHYLCDQAALVTDNPSSNITGTNGVCCTGGNCQYGTEGTSCSSATKTIDGLTYTPGLCANPTQLLGISSIKAKLDQFFLALDGNITTAPNYFVTSVVALTGSSIQTLQTARTVDDNAVNAASPGQGLKLWLIDRGDRYMELGELVGNGSQQYDLASSDYSGIFDGIGQQMILQKNTYILPSLPGIAGQFALQIQHQNGSLTAINNNKFIVNSNLLTLTDPNLILSLASTDQLILQIVSNN